MQTPPYKSPHIVSDGLVCIKPDNAITLEQLDFGMCVEKIIRKLKGLTEDDEKYPPNYFNKMADVMEEYIKKE